MKDQDYNATNLAVGISEEAVVGLLPNFRYQRAIDPFIGENAINVCSFTQISLKLDSASCFYSKIRHDLCGVFDKGYFAFHDSKNSRYDIFSLNLLNIARSLH